MQKMINGVALLSGLVSLSVLGGGAYLYVQIAVPALASIPYVGWLAGGWALLLGQKAGSSLGSTVGSVFNDC